MLNKLTQTFTTAVLAFVCQAVASDSLLQVDSRAGLARRPDLSAAGQRAWRGPTDRQWRDGDAGVDHAGRRAFSHQSDRRDGGGQHQREPVRR